MFSWIRRVLFAKQPGKGRLTPECTWILKVDGDLIRLEHPSKGSKTLPLSEIRAFYVDTNDSGPMGIDVWFILVGPSEVADIVFPQGATGEDTVLDLLFKFPGFNFEAFTEAMACVENKRFVCWASEA